MQYKIGICDDEEMIIKVNKIYIEEIAKKHNMDIVIYSALNGDQIISNMKQHNLDIIFMDIDMKGISGIEAAVEIKKVNRDTSIIFVTAHSEFALTAYEIDAIGYLVKPIDPAKLEKLLLKAARQIVLEKNKITNSMLIITEDNVKKRLPQYKIICIEKQSNQCIAYMKDSTHYFYDTIANIKGKLESYFYQINQGVIINNKYIKDIEGNQMLLKNGMSYTIGRKYIKEIRNMVYQ